MNGYVDWRFVAGFKCYGKDGLYLLMYTKDERSRAQSFHCTCTRGNKPELVGLSYKNKTYGVKKNNIFSTLSLEVHELL